jgi:cytochrome c556
MRIGMFSRFSNLLIWSTTLIFASNSMGSLSVEEAVQKRIEKFKLSQTNIKKLSKFIRSGDISASDYLVDFHVEWSGEMLLMFPAGSEASTSNGSDASSDIWRDTTGFKKQVTQYNLSSKALREALKSRNISEINENFEGLVESCKSCHKQFRN